tara:strand:+ start:594 stop:833 length:240 start_codon:yes stop_codon:yes gene_type:complete
MDILINLKNRLEEYTNVLYIDYERESILLEVRKNYFDEVIKEVKRSLEYEIVFVKEINKGTITVLISSLVIIDVYDDQE